eukprot:561075-Pyramimonas_sp.AAC.1
MRSRVAVCGSSAGVTNGKPVHTVKSIANSAQETDMGAIGVSSAAHRSCEKYQTIAGNKACW